MEAGLEKRYDYDFFFSALSASFFSLGVGLRLGKTKLGTNPTVYDCYELVFFGFSVSFPCSTSYKDR